MLEQERAAAEARAWLRIAPELGILSRDRHCCFENSERTPAIVVADAFSDENDDTYLSRGVVIEGRPGCGKTRGLTSAARRLAVWGGGENVVKFYRFPNLVTALLDNDERDETLEACCCQENELIIDDLGSSYVKRDGLVVGLIEEIIVTREGQQTAMLASTNLSPRQFRATFGDRVYDRLRGPWGAWINVDRPSMRCKPKPGRQAQL